MKSIEGMKKELNVPFVNEYGMITRETDGVILTILRDTFEVLVDLSSFGLSYNDIGSFSINGSIMEVQFKNGKVIRFHKIPSRTDIQSLKMDYNINTGFLVLSGNRTIVG